MAFQLPSVKVKAEKQTHLEQHINGYGVPDPMIAGLCGLNASKRVTDVSHPLMVSELNYTKNKNNLNMSMLRNTQGLHAPMKIAMELKAAKQIGRLPFMASSNIMHEVLTGRDIEMNFEDILGLPEFREIQGQPHAMVEISLGIL